MMQIRMGRFEASSVKRASRPHHMLTTVYSYSSHKGSQSICTEPVQVQYLLPVQCPSVSDPGPNLSPTLTARIIIVGHASHRR